MISCLNKKPFFHKKKYLLFYTQITKNMHFLNLFQIKVIFLCSKILATYNEYRVPFEKMKSITVLPWTYSPKNKYAFGIDRGCQMIKLFFETIVCIWLICLQLDSRGFYTDMSNMYQFYLLTSQVNPKLCTINFKKIVKIDFA